MLEHAKRYGRIESTLDAIDEASLDDLQNQEFVANLIRKIGLYGANEEVYGSEVEHGTGDESGVWQEPTQSSKLLVWLSDKGIKDFIEIGSWNGCWAFFMAAYLSRFGLEKACSVDIEDNALDVVKHLAAKYNLEFKGGSSKQFYGQNHDFAFIDGGRDYQTIYQHWANLGNSCRIVAIHDINCRFAPDIKKFWHDQLKEIATMEILDHPNGYGYDMMGIGIICL